MPKAEEIQVIVELTHHTLHALRAVNGTIEAGGECVLENKPALEALLGAVAPSWKTDGIKASSVWPDTVDWHLSTDTEAFLDRSGDSLLAIAAATRGTSKAAFAYATCNAGDGRPITSEGTGKWFLSCSSVDSLERLAGVVTGQRVEWDNATPAAFARAGAISGVLRTAGKGSVVLWDLGADRSNLLLITANGVEGVAPCAAGLNAIFEAVQTALKLKFRGAGARLFFNEGYDFTEPGPKICAIVGASLKQAMGLLPHPEGPPALACIGLTGKQAWFFRDIAAVAGTAPWAPDLGKLAGILGLKFADEAVAASFSPTSVGVFELLASRIRGKDTWHPAWIEAEPPADELEETPEAAQPEAAATPVPPAFRVKPSLAHEGAPAPPPLTPKAAPLEEPAAPVAASRTNPPFPTTRPAGSAHPVPPPSAAAELEPPPEPSSDPVIAFPLPVVPAAGARKGVVAPARVKTGMTRLPFEAANITRPDPAAPENQPKSKLGVYIGIVAVAALIFAAIFVVLDARMERIKEHDLAQQEALAHHLAEVRLKEAEQLARANADQSRKDVQTAIALTQKQTEDSTRRTVMAEMEAVRISKLPGTLMLATAPPGALVSIDGAAPLAAPVAVEGIAPGAHRVHITLEGHDPVDMRADIRGSKTTDLGTIRLESSLGGLEVTSIPDALDFVLHAAAEPTGKPIRTGRTPAALAGIPRGDYLVTYSRPGCHDHTEKVSVVKGAKTPVETKYLDGTLELTSDPSGAWVDKDGTRLGSTPLVLHDLTPKLASFELTLPGYDPTPISCEIPEGQTLKLTAQLLRRDRIFKASEVKTLPASYQSPQPELSPEQRKMNADVTVAFVVQRDGTVVDVRVAKATDDDIGRRCAAAVAKWKFRPGTAADDRTVDVSLEVPFKFLAANP